MLKYMYRFLDDVVSVEICGLALEDNDFVKHTIVQSHGNFELACSLVMG